MNLSENLFNQYFSNKLCREEFLEQLDINNERFSEYYLDELEETVKKHNAGRLENMIYVLFIWAEERNDAGNFKQASLLGILNELLITDWHCQHENIVMLLEKISSLNSIDYLYNAIELNPQYLSWDDNYAFEVKCVRAIYYIGKEKSFPYLKKLCSHENDVIRNMAERQIRKLELENFS